MTEYKKDSGKVTIYDVAQVAGVSYSTVSRVLNNSAGVRPDKYQRVIQAMSQLGFAVNQQARSLAGGLSHTIGVIVWTTQTSSTGRILQGIQAELAEINHDLLLYSTLYKKLKTAAYIGTLTRGIADGFLLIVPDEDQSYIQVLQQQKRPYVIIDQRSVNVAGPLVTAANHKGAYEATRYLLGLGHRRIGFITGKAGWGITINRFEGYKDALRDGGVDFDANLVREGNFERGYGYESALSLLKLADRPTAIVGSNDETALGAMEAVRDSGLRLVQDVSIVGFDDSYVAAQTHPALTSVQQPFEEMGRAAVRLLMEYIAQPDLPPRAIELSTQLIIRDSCQSPNTLSS